MTTFLVASLTLGIIVYVLLQFMMAPDFCDKEMSRYSQQQAQLSAIQERKDRDRLRQKDLPPPASPFSLQSY